MSVKKLAIIGTGQVGTSLAMAAALNHSAEQIVAYDNTAIEVPFLEALGKKGIDNGNIRFTIVPKEIEGADLVVLCTPVRSFDAAIKTIAPYVTPQSVFTDVGSVKGLSQERIRQTLDAQVGLETPYVPFHILNGNAGSGPLTGGPDVFNAPGVLIPGQASPKSEQMVEKFFASLGDKTSPDNNKAQIHRMSAEAHDKILGTISHLEHVIMFSVMKTDFIQETLNERGLDDPGNWLRRMTRIAVAGPKMWSDNFLDNREKILETAAYFRGSLVEFSDMVSGGSINDSIDRLHDFAKDKPGKEISSFSMSDVAGHESRISGFLGVLSLAIAKNAQRIEQETGQPLAPIANPSFKDGLGPVAIAPESVKYVTSKNRAAIPGLADDFLQQFDKTIVLIKENDDMGIKRLVEEVGQSRAYLNQAFAPPAGVKSDPVPVLVCRT